MLITEKLDVMSSGGQGQFPDCTEIFSQFLAGYAAVRHIHKIFEIGEARNRNSLLLHIRQCTGEAGALVGIVEYVPARDGNRVGRGNTEHVVEARVMGMIVDTMQGGFDTAPTSMSESTQTAKVADDLVVNRDDVIKIQQINDPSTQSARRGVRK